MKSSVVVIRDKWDGYGTDPKAGVGLVFAGCLVVLFGYVLYLYIQIKRILARYKERRDLEKGGCDA